jgi:PAS domain S-box-containing protein
MKKTIKTKVKSNKSSPQKSKTESQKKQVKKAGTKSNKPDTTFKHKKMDDALKEKIEHFRKLSEATFEGIAITEKGALLETNKTFVKMFGYKLSEVPGMHVSQFVAPEYHDFVMQKVLSNYDKPYESVCVKKSGERFLVQVCGKSIHYKGRIARVTAIRDITERKKAEEALREKEAQLHTIIVQNLSIREKWGGMIGKRPEDFAQDENTLAIWLENNRRAFSGETVKGETEFLLPDGKKGMFYNIISPIYDKDKIKGILGINIDISERKGAEEALKKAHDELEKRVRERTKALTKANKELKNEISMRKKIDSALLKSEKRYRVIATSTSDLIWEADMKKDSYTWFGDIDSTLGYELGEFPRTISGFLENIHPEDREIIDDAFEESIKSKEGFYLSYRIRCKNGTYRHWEERGKFISFEDGKPVLYAGAISDITDRKIAEEELRESERKFKGLSREFNVLLNAIPDSLILLSSDMKIIWANKAAASLLNKEISGINGNSYFSLCNDVFTLKDDHPSTRSFLTGKDETSEIKTFDGRVLDIRAFPIKDESGKVKNVIELARDITAKVRLEEEAKMIQTRLMHANKMTSLGTLVSGVAHEINNPNSFIMSNAQLFTEIWNDIIGILKKHYEREGELTLTGLGFSELQNVVPKLLEGITDGTERIGHIVDNLRNFAKPDVTSLDEEVDVNDLIMTANAMLENQIKKYTDNFHVECEENIPKIKGSNQQIEQVIINLIINALQALSDRKCGIRIFTSFDKKTNSVMIEVIDEGKGMSEGLLERITEPFFTTKHDSGGTGLGLSISYAIIKEHKGSLEFKSEPGKGTTAYVRLPVNNVKGT